MLVKAWSSSHTRPPHSMCQCRRSEEKFLAVPAAYLTQEARRRALKF